MEPLTKPPATESELTAHIARHFRVSPQDNRLLVGIGDDAAAMHTAEGTLLHTADALVEGSHFTLDQCTPHELGWKSIAVNQSDIAAMGGTPATALVTLGIGPQCNTEWINQFCRGIANALDSHGGICIGGDTVKSNPVFVSIAMTGTAKQDKLLLRSAAQPGDLICVTGNLGGAAGWLATHSSTLRKRHFKPQPRVAEGNALASIGVKCAMDISDGLVLDLQRMAEASGVHATLHATTVPAEPGLVEAVGSASEALALALGGGEDYELLFACPPTLMETVKEHPDINATPIGEFTAQRTGTETVSVLDGNGQPLQVRRKGWDPISRQ